MAYTVALETEVATSLPLHRKRKSVEKLAIPLWLEVNLGREEVPMAGKVRSAGASVYRRAMHVSVRALTEGVFYLVICLLSDGDQKISTVST